MTKPISQIIDEVWPEFIVKPSVKDEHGYIMASAVTTGDPEDWPRVIVRPGWYDPKPFMTYNNLPVYVRKSRSD